MRYIYIASPYTIGDTEENVHRSLLVAERIIKGGDIPFIPLLYHFWHCLDEKPYEYWIKLSKAWVLQCDVVMRLPGESKGADAEVALARSVGIPVILFNDLED